MAELIPPADLIHVMGVIHTHSHALTHTRSDDSEVIVMCPSVLQGSQGTGLCVQEASVHTVLGAEQSRRPTGLRSSCNGEKRVLVTPIHSTCAQQYEAADSRRHAVGLDRW